MDAWREILRKESEGTEDSFVYHLRCSGRWDMPAYYQLFDAMLACCKAHDDQETVEIWIAEVFWYLSWWVKQQVEELWPDSYGLMNGAVNFDHFAFWLFAKLDRRDDQFESLND